MRLLPALLAVTLFGCATVGRNFDATSLGWLRPQESTRQEILARMGEPMRVAAAQGHPPRLRMRASSSRTSRSVAWARCSTRMRSSTTRSG